LTGISEGPALIENVLGQGRTVVLRQEAGVDESWREVRRAIADSVEQLAGKDGREALERDGLERLHEQLTPEQIGPLRDEVMGRVREELFRMTCRVAREVLGIDGEFFVDDYTILRVNFPYEVAIRASHTAENPGIGRVSDNARKDHAAAKVIDPVYNPRGYHRDQPPAAWAHGPHLDTWTGHSRDGVNLWWAISEVPAENSMFFYPELFGQPLDPDPTSLYLRAGQPLPQPTLMPLRAGELLVFNPEVLHGTHLNVSGMTRVAVSTRINARRPVFDPTCFYAREFWHSSTDLERDDFEQIIRFEREENLAEPPRPAEPSPQPARVRLEEPLTREKWTPVCPASQVVAPGEKVIVEDVDGDAKLLLLGTSRGLVAIGARCPHLGTCLSDGFHDDESIHCPAHAIRFSLDTGRSASDALRLPVADVREQDGLVLLRLR
jgi:nitrite reductase/ring-hydroxylating ferredoxin subunit